MYLSNCLVIAGLAFSALTMIPPAQAAPAASPAITPAATATATAPSPAATAPTAAPTRLPSVDEVLSKDPKPFKFTDAKVAMILQYLGETYGLRVQNEFQFVDDGPDGTGQEFTLTLGDPERPLTARQAINLVNSSLLALGYTLVESVRTSNPPVVVTVVPTKRNPIASIAVFYGTDPKDIPDNDQLRTQVMELKKADPEKVAQRILTVCPTADITVNAATRTLVVTDTGARLRTAAVIIGFMEETADSN